MTRLAESIQARLNTVSPYHGFEHQLYPHDPQGTGGNDILRQPFDAVRPNFIVEVGCWKGASACFWASLMRERGIDGAVLCVDTWLGGLDHLVKQTPGWDLGPYTRNGYPTLYYQFLANVVYAGLQDYIIPLPTTSSIAARWLALQSLQPGLIYIDGSHEEDDVYADLVSYWKVLSLGGIMCGDDWALPWQGVICAVNRFVREREISMQTVGQIWVLQKQLSVEGQFLHSQMENRPKPPTSSSPG